LVNEVDLVTGKEINEASGQEGVTVMIENLLVAEAEMMLV